MTEKRNAHVQQNRHEADQKLHSQFDGIGLTKRNSDYMFKFNKELQKTNLSAERKAEIINQMKDELLVEQKHGATARNLYGTVGERVDYIVNPPKKKTSLMDNFWPNVAYNSLFFFVLFNLLYGVVDLISKTSTKQSVGIFSLTAMSIVFGLCAPFLTRLLDNTVKHTYSGLMRGLFMLLVIVAWVLAFLVLVAIPQQGINIVVSPIINFILAIVGIAADFYVYRHFTITVNFFTPKTTGTRK
ncbi:DUF1129 domain-containing protein [Apilactobacillus bombintestini]|uniref:DUF1129 family protein n=1 Tax=Apilactobacillus bombintestini TaxID=2419772 RepID=A0A387B1G5_9LACO|nr:DUF1129 family protein [Apilactobacillus bombintestini]AYF92980.1 DUF1129 family protein [Apilactobacillus bombintestini]